MAVIRGISRPSPWYILNKKTTKQTALQATICTLGPDFDGDGEADQASSIQMIHGQWRRNSTAGGCRNDIRSFATNPQYLLTVTQAGQ